ncbi:MAG: aminoglycoside phosphotransferase family protein [Planctomycetes bacterium]|nr:aminoglycoside phosphotransferase family protein [Planctomycetota bacterium]
MKRAPIAILQHDVGDHPAVRAWRELRPAQVEPDCVHVLRERRKSNLYRLPGVGIDGSPVIAKRGRASRAAIERTVYEEALPHLPVTAPRYYGSVPDGDGAEYRWLFLEDVGLQKYSRTNPEHMALAGRWLGRMHAAATRLARASRLPEHLPEGGPSRFLERLRMGRRDILANLDNPFLTAEEFDALREILRLGDHLEANWNRVEAACEGLPPTLVHNDFQPKNAYVRDGPTGPELFPFDWETAGWGLRAADLARVDVAAYEAALREGSPDLGTSAVARIAIVGEVFRCLAAISYDTPQLAHLDRRHLLEPMENLMEFLGSLSKSVEASGLAR